METKHGLPRVHRGGHSQAIHHSSLQPSSHPQEIQVTKLTTPSITVAHLLPRRRARSHLLPHHRNDHKLAQHRLPLRLHLHHAPSNLRPTPRPKTLHHRCRRFATSRQLGPLRRLALLLAHRRTIRRGHVRADPRRPRPTIRPRRARPLLGSLVHQPRPRSGYRFDVPCQSLWSSAGTAGCSVLG